MKLTTTGIKIYIPSKRYFMIIVNDDTSLEAVDQPKAICFSNSFGYAKNSQTLNLPIPE
jgi:hypothetical protein